MKSHPAQAKAETRRGCMPSETVLNSDAFAPPVQFNFPGGQPNFRSPVGACLNLLVSLVTLVYFAENLFVLYERGDTTFTQSTQYDHFTQFANFT